jgi:hypothetical protein
MGERDRPSFARGYGGRAKWATCQCGMRSAEWGRAGRVLCFSWCLGLGASQDFAEAAGEG